MSDNRTIDGNGAAHHGKGIKGAGEFAPSLDAEQPASITLTRDREPVRSPSRELGFHLHNLEQQTIAVQTREDLQTTLRNLREINPALAKIELADDGEGVLYVAAAWDAAGNDISEGDWFQDGSSECSISDLTTEDPDRFPITARYFDYDGSPMSTIAESNDEHLAWDVDVDKALATNATDPGATTALDRLNAISQGSRSLAAALEKVQISEGHAFIDAIEDLSKKLPTGVRSIIITEQFGDDAGPSAEFFDEDDMFIAVEGPEAEDVLDMASNIHCSLYELRERGDLITDHEDGVSELTIRFTR